MRSFVTVVAALAVSAAAQEADPCPRPKRAVFEAKVSFAENPSDQQFRDELASLRSRGVVAKSQRDAAAIVRVDAAQFKALAARQDVRVEPWEPLVETPLALIDVTGRPRLDQAWSPPGWQTPSSKGARRLYIVKLHTPFTPEMNEFFEGLAFRLGGEPASAVEGGAVDSGSSAAAFHLLLSADEAMRVAKLPEVRWVAELGPLLKVSAGVIGVQCPLLRPDQLAGFSSSLRARKDLAFTVGIDEATQPSGALRSLLDGHTESSLAPYMVTGTGELLRQLALLPETRWFEDVPRASIDGLVPRSGPKD